LSKIRGAIPLLEGPNTVVLGMSSSIVSFATDKRIADFDIGLGDELVTISLLTNDPTTDTAFRKLFPEQAAES
jgi:hypothetical protein